MLIAVFGGQSFAEGKRPPGRPKEEHGYLSQRAGMELWDNIGKVGDKPSGSMEALERNTLLEIDAAEASLNLLPASGGGENFPIGTPRAINLPAPDDEVVDLKLVRGSSGRLQDH